MLQSWNKFCHTGGIIEFDVKFPGKHDIGGLWPAVWLLGNLGRATYLASTNLLWPWSYHQCDRKLQKAQEISGCDITSHFSLKPGMGRGATEIDIIEVMAGPDSALPIVKNNVHRPYTSMTLQVNNLMSGSLALSSLEVFFNTNCFGLTSSGGTWHTRGEASAPGGHASRVGI